MILQQSTALARAAQAILALASGLALFLVVVPVTGILSALAIPAEYFAYFGRHQTGLALLLLNTLTVAVPLAALGFVWCAATLRLTRVEVVTVASLCLLGFALGIGYSYIRAVLDFMSLDAAGKVPLSTFVGGLFPWWNAPVLVAVPLGIVSAAMLRTRLLRAAH